MYEMNLNIHGLVRVWAPDLSEEVYNGLKEMVGHFFVEEKLDLKTMDLLILPLASAKLKETLENILPSPYGMSFVEHHGDIGIVLNYRGQPDLILMVGNEITIYYSPRKRNLRRIYGLMLFSINLVLHKKMGLLYHGAAVVKDDFSLLFTGLRGSKKTQLVMTMLEKGWDYLSDDKILIHNGHMYMFQDIIPIADHHLEALPWLYDLLPEKAKRKKSPIKRKVRKHIAAFSRRFFSKHFLPIMEKIYDPHNVLKLQEIFPSCNIVESAIPSKVVLLSLGDKISCTPIASHDVLDEIDAVQSLTFFSMGPLEQLVFFCNKTFSPSVGEIVKKNLGNSQFYRLTIPGLSEINDAYQVLTENVTKDIL